MEQWRHQGDLTNARGAWRVTKRLSKACGLNYRDQRETINKHTNSKTTKTNNDYDKRQEDRINRPESLVFHNKSEKK